MTATAGSPSHKADLWRGVYDAPRAAALSGVPQRTLARWAATGLYVPSISPEPRTRFWSWFDLLALRTVDCLRKPSDGLARVPLAKIRAALQDLEARGLSTADLHDLVLRSSSGELFFERDQDLTRADASGQGAMPGVLAVVRPYKLGPDLLEPRPLLRIVPGKLSGEPHLLDTRIASATIYALHRDGFSDEEIVSMYPEAELDAIRQAVDLEQTLSRAA